MSLKSAMHRNNGLTMGIFGESVCMFYPSCKCTENFRLEITVLTPRVNVLTDFLLSGCLPFDAGILQGISDLLITNDESEVRTMVAACRHSQEVLKETNGVHGMPRLVEFIKRLTPSLTETSKHVDRRQKELTNATHAAELVDHCEHVRF